MSRSIDDFEQFLQKSRIPIRIACQSKTNWPVVISIWYIYRDGLIYCATKRSAKIITHLESSAKCAYEIASDTPPYCGVRGQAIARIDHDLGPAILNELIDRYLGGKNNELAKLLIKNQAEESAIIIKPVNVFSWDFSKRMQPVSPAMINLMAKNCPD